MRIVKSKKCEGTTIRIAVNDLKMPVAMLGTVEDIAKAGVIEDVHRDDENWKRWIVIWNDDDTGQYLFDTRDEAIEYITGDEY